jgi:hypothetical protein
MLGFKVIRLVSFECDQVSQQSLIASELLLFVGFQKLFWVSAHCLPLVGELRIL